MGAGKRAFRSRDRQRGVPRGKGKGYQKQGVEKKLIHGSANHRGNNVSFDEGPEDWEGYASGEKREKENTDDQRKIL